MARYLSTQWIAGPKGTVEVVKLRNQTVYRVTDPTTESEVFRGSRAKSLDFARGFVGADS